MLTHAFTSQYYLVSPRDLSCPPLDPLVQDLLPAFRNLLDWLKESICQPHPQLGREGAICPYVSTSIEKGLLWLTAYRGCPDIEEVSNVARAYRDWFLALEPLKGGDAQYKTILILFPDLQQSDASDLIDQAHLLLKPEFVNRGLMIGQFHSLSNEPGAWNPAFHPLRSPIPLLVMRLMASHDILFLSKEERYVRAYLKAYGHRVPRGLQRRAQEAARQYGISYPPDARADKKEEFNALERKEL